ncbi:unnamed protein product [Ranitomeya imitator]|uniref:Uncharacterized protein n=1 Tax=Ranitomeya imitator TaxID=111125 RepID=A0ABN9LCU5_9NEOB|nr:unnamed protein product [Ranitomeya imitator]
MQEDDELLQPAGPDDTDEEGTVTSCTPPNGGGEQENRNYQKKDTRLLDATDTSSTKDSETKQNSDPHRPGLDMTEFNNALAELEGRAVEKTDQKTPESSEHGGDEGSRLGNEKLSSDEDAEGQESEELEDYEDKCPDLVDLSGKTKSTDHSGNSEKCTRFIVVWLCLKKNISSPVPAIPFIVLLPGIAEVTP